MKTHMTISMFVLVFTGYLCNNKDVAADTTMLSYNFSTPSKVTQAPESEAPPHRNDQVPEKHLSTLLVAALSISFVVLIFVIIGTWYAWKKSKGSSVEISSAPSGEHGVSLKKISTDENKYLALDDDCQESVKAENLTVTG